MPAATIIRWPIACGSPAAASKADRWWARPTTSDSASWKTKSTCTICRDLKQRGLLDSTLIIWGGEFGRTPMVEIRKASDSENAGRDHHPLAYSMWLAGGGIKGGQVVGKTDDFGFGILEDKIHVHDLQRSEAARPARFHADHLGRRIRTHAHGRNPQSQRFGKCRPRPSSAGL